MAQEQIREWEEAVGSFDGQEYQCEYSNGPNQRIDLLVIAKTTKQTYRWQPYVGWQPTGWPEYSHEAVPVQLRGGDFQDMRDDSGFVQIVKVA